MSLFKRAISEKSLTQRLPFVGQRISPIYNSTNPVSGSMEQQLSATSATGWLFAAVNRIAEGVAMQGWDTFVTNGENGLPQRVPDHPLAALWEDINPFWTRNELLMVSENHYRLVGEVWWVLIRNAKGEITEIWPVRPDRMTPVKHDTLYCTGYIYRRGIETVPLGIDDVIFMRNPDPLDDYRGKGVVQAILADIENEKYAAQWSRNFFLNSAQPGGIIEFPERLNDEEFETVMLRWRETHQGISNAHRVAILEGGTWKDNKFTQREMQFIDNRKVNRDIILGAFGVPMPILGITEAVNRANAEAGEYVFAKYLVKPALERYKEAINYRIAKTYGDGVYVSYKDPVPPDPTVNLNTAIQGYQVGLLSNNEGRRLLGQNPKKDGDVDFEGNPVDAIEPENVISTESMKDAYTYHAKGIKTANDPDRHLSAIWHQRLMNESADLLKYLNVLYIEPNNVYDTIANELIVDLGITPGISKEHIDVYNWDWEQKYGSEVKSELKEMFMRVFEDSLDKDLPMPSTLIINAIADSYAEHKMIEILSAAGVGSIVSTTRNKVNKLVTENKKFSDLKDKVAIDYIFSASRAQSIVRTEISGIRGFAQWKAAVLQGHTQKRSITVNADENTSKECLENEAAGWIGILDKFPSGEYTHPFHTNCNCIIETRLHQPEKTVTIDKTLCKECGHRLNIRGLSGKAMVYCDKCRKEFEMSS